MEKKAYSYQFHQTRQTNSFLFFFPSTASNESHSTQHLAHDLCVNRFDACEHEFGVHSRSITSKTQHLVPPLSATSSISAMLTGSTLSIPRLPYRRLHAGYESFRNRRGAEKSLFAGHPHSSIFQGMAPSRLAGWPPITPRPRESQRLPPPKVHHNHRSVTPTDDAQRHNPARQYVAQMLPFQA